MAKPVYIICCEFSVEDFGTRCLTYINVIEKVQFRRTAQSTSESTPSPTTQMRVFSVWRADPDDQNQKYEFELNVFVPDKEKMFEMSRGEFVFAGATQRLVTHLLGTPPIEGPGTMRFQNRIRKVGTDAWVTQEYLVDFEEVPVPAPSLQSQPA